MGLKTGQTLVQRYEMQKQLGRGGHSRVYLVHDIISGRLRAVKEIPKSLGIGGYDFARREAELVWRLKYPYFPEIFDILEMEEADYIVMEYLQGETAGERLRRLGPQPVEEVVRWVKDLCLMLSYLHHGVPPMIYCDMKPDNIMIQSGGNLRLIDFGAVWEMDKEGTQLRLGTRGYAAPEQFDSKGCVDVRTDIYALGMTMYQLITGQTPGYAQGEGLSNRYLKRFMSRGMQNVIRKCIKKEPKGRYQSCEELRKDLEKAIKM